MNEPVLLALISLIGTLVGSFGGIMTSGRLTGYRIDRLEEKVNKLNEGMDIIHTLEKNIAVQGEQIEELKRKVG